MKANMQALEEMFTLKAQKLKNLTGIKLDNETKLKFYGLYKVATVGKYNDKNKIQGGFFDFEAKYKNQSWEKCSIYTKEEAMIEYIKLYNKITGEQDDFSFLESGPGGNAQVEEKILNFNIDIPDDFESASLYSSGAKQAQKEISEFLASASDEVKLFHQLKEKIYKGDIITSSSLKQFETENNFSLLSARDPSGQTLLHISVDAFNNSAVQSLVDLGYAQQMISVQDNFLMTPLHIGAINYDFGIFLLLLDLNADDTIRDKENKTCVDYLMENDECEIADEIFTKLKISKK